MWWNILLVKIQTLHNIIQSVGVTLQQINGFWLGTYMLSLPLLYDTTGLFYES